MASSVSSRILKALGDPEDMLALAYIEGAVVELFSRFSPEDLYAAITKNVDLWDMSWGEFEPQRTQLKVMIRDPRVRPYLRHLSAENVLEWLRNPDARPDLAGLVLNTPGGPDWVKRQLARFVEELQKPINGLQGTEFDVGKASQEAYLSGGKPKPWWI